MLEVCVDTISAALAAVRAGAQRIELCAALDVGGVTPCTALIQAVRKQVQCPLMVLIRPRTGNFIYDQVEIELTLASVSEALRAGVDGVVVGALTPEHELDLDALRAMRNAVGDAELVMHRAFDFIADREAAVDQLVELGFARVLTSGGSSGQVTNHLDSLARLVGYAQGRIIIMPGGGVTADNAHELIHRTVCTQIHGSFRLPATDPIMNGLGTHRKLDHRSISLVAGMI